jgi:hypothetical protein
MALGEPLTDRDAQAVGGDEMGILDDFDTVGWYMHDDVDKVREVPT